MGSCMSGANVVDPDAEKYKPQVALNGEYQKYKLIEKREYNHDCIIFRFSLESHTSILGLPIGKHMMIKYDDAKVDYPIIRAYTPISNDGDIGYFELLIKIYSDGEMTQKLNGLAINEYVQCKGPLGNIHYDGASHLRITEGIGKFRDINVNKIGMLAGGTGITPMYQILKSINQNKEEDQTQISLIFSNKTENDILLKDELYEMSENNKNIKIYYTVSKITASSENKEEWKGGIGRIDLEKIENNLYPPNDDVVVMYCGPIGFNKTMKKLLTQIGHNQSNVLRF